MANYLLSRRSFLSSVALLSTVLEGCTNQSATPVGPSTPTKMRITAWGGSLTQGTGGTSYPTQLAALFPDRTVNNYGLPGQLARQTAARQGGLPVTLTIQGNRFTGTAAIPVQEISTPLLSTVSHSLPLAATGTVKGVKCKLLRTATGVAPNQVESYTLAPTLISTDEIPPNSLFIPDDAKASRGDIQLLWFGRLDTPNFTGVDVLFEDCVKYITAPAQFLIIGILNAVDEVDNNINYKSIIKFNSMLSVKYGTNYIPSTPPTPEELQAINYTPTQQDLIEIKSNTFPHGMRFDFIHLNTVGYSIFANRIAARIKEKGW
ncbi:hypothetical protein [Spirosoma linguale]|uniref:Uncharacterized protein n=1 Tax=Spirosoma linguale (strain ATCC 33905 / DSM 74 / LMG 10896 / Claus 1) TaxID=504472 RepID=D2QU82_SPILD|nr:hypothetical protein Slin_6406 [Spirosoma linguale DSM 74]